MTVLRDPRDLWAQDRGYGSFGAYVDDHIPDYSNFDPFAPGGAQPWNPAAVLWPTEEELQAYGTQDPVTEPPPSADPGPDHFAEQYTAPWTEQFVAPDAPVIPDRGPVALPGAPQINPLSFREYTPGEAFTYREYEPGAAFAAPTMAEVEQAPGYQFRLREGQRALENAAAARGTLMTGGTLADLLEYGQNYASTEYDRAHGRAFNTWAANDAQRRGDYQLGYGTAADIWARNDQQRLQDYVTDYRTARDIWGANTDAQFAGADRAFRSAVAENELMRQRDEDTWRRHGDTYDRRRDEYLMDYGIFERNQEKAFDRNRWGAELGLGADAP